MTEGAIARLTGVQDRIRHTLADLLRSHRQQIIAAYEQKVRSLPPARDLPRSAIVDRLPLVLDRIQRIVSRQPDEGLGSVGRDHAVDRLARGFELEHLVDEYGFLRDAILDQWASVAGGARIGLDEIRLLDRSFDACLRDAVVEHAKLRGRTLRAVNRLSEAALGPGDLDAFLAELIRAAMESLPDVDTAAILLVEDDHLRLRAASGLEEQFRHDLTLKMGEGFAGRIAQARAPMSLRNAAESPVIHSAFVRDLGIRALYGVPLARGDELLGVAYIGSLTANEFSEDDKLLFGTMANRASAVIARARLLAETSRAAAVQQFLSDASKQLSETLDYRAMVENLSHLAVPTIADWCVIDLIEDGKLTRVSVAHADPAKEARVRQLLDKYPEDPESATGIPNVIRTGRSELSQDIPDTVLQDYAHDKEHLRLLLELKLHSYVVAPLKAHGRVVGAVTLVMAESGRRYEEADVLVAEELARRIVIAIENARLYSAAQAAVQTRERILAVVSHDLRNQLGVLRMTSRLLAILARRGDTEAMLKSIETIDRAAGTMRRLVDDLLDMAALQAGRLSIIARDVDLKQIIDEACEPQVPVAREKGVALECPVVESVQVHADPERILQVLGNLLGNALKFCEGGDSVRLAAETRRDDVLISVTDSGPGIPDGDVAQLFHPYRPLRRSERSGTGLGLYIAKGIVERHGGRIWVECKEGKGTTFSFTLPRAGRTALTAPEARRWQPR